VGVASVLLFFVSVGGVTAHDSRAGRPGPGGAASPLSPVPALPAIRPAPDFALVDLDGQLVQLSKLHGRVVLLSFIYTNCSSACPLLTNRMALLQRRLGGRADVHLLTITVDPDRDGPEAMRRYAARFGEALAAIDADTSAAPAKLRGYAELYAEVLRSHRMCLCGMLAAEYPTLPVAMQASVVSFFDHNEAWLEHVLEDGRGDGSLHFSGSSRDVARMIISCLEGAMLVSRSYGDIPRFQHAATSLVESITSPSVVKD